MASFASSSLGPLSSSSPFLVPTERRSLAVRGSDAFGWLNGLVTSDVSKLAPHAAMPALLVERKGKIMADVLVVSPGDGSLLVDLPAAGFEALVAHLDAHLIMEDVELEPLEQPLRLWLGAEARPRAEASGLPYARYDLRGITAHDPVAAAVVLGGEPPPALDEDLAAQLRLALGLPAFGLDFDTSLYPQEAALDALAVSFDKGCYLGQEVVYMLKARGSVRRRLAVLEIDGPAPEPGREVHSSAGKLIGHTRSAAGMESGSAAFALLGDKAWTGEVALQIDGAPVRVRA